MVALRLTRSPSPVEEVIEYDAEDSVEAEREEKDEVARLLCDRIETVAPGFGIEIMTLAATLAEPLAPRQIISSLAEEPEADVSDLLDTLANRVGEKQLYRIAPVASDVPERSVQKIAPLAPAVGADGQTIGHVRPGFSRTRSRSRRSRCCPIIRRSPLAGAASAAA